MQAINRSSTSALLYALMWPIALASAWHLPDALTSVLCLLIIFPLVVFRDWRGAALSGLVIGLAGWFRGDFLALVPLLAIALWNWRRATTLVVAWFIPTLCLGLFWLVHYDTFTLSRPGAGLLLWQGLGQQANIWHIEPTDEAAGVLLTASGLQYGTSAGDAFLMREWIRHVTEQPMWFVGTALARFVRLMGYHFGILLAIPALAGFVMTRRRYRFLTAICAALWLSRVVPFVLMRDEPRFALPLLIVYIIGTSLLVEAVKLFRTDAIRER